MTVLSLALWASAPALAQSFTIVDDGIVVPLGAPGDYHEFNVGSPTVTYDPDEDEFVMFFEYRGAWGSPSRCASGAGTEWGIGRATSDDGVVWTVDPTAALHPTAGTFWECAAVHPNVVYEGPGQWHLFFKAWQENGKVCDDDDGNLDGIDDPEWGCDLVTGIGYASSTDGINWTVSDTMPVWDPSVDNTPEDFGWPRVVKVSGKWMMFFNYGDNGITLATADDPAGPWSWEGFVPGDGYSEVLEPSSSFTWMEDELIVGDVSCNDEPGTDMLDMWFGGHDRDPADFWSTPLSRALGYAAGSDVDTWTIGNPEEIFWTQSDITSNVAWRSWSTVPVGDDYIIYYQRFIPGEGNQVGLAYTSVDTKWDVKSIQSDVCSWYGNAPDTGDDAYTTVEEVELTVPAPGVLDNDVDHERNDFTIALESQPANGTVVLQADGSFVYTPDGDFFGVDTFTYSASDDVSTSVATQVSITVTNEPDMPVGTDDAYTLSEDGSLLVDAGSGILANDSDADGETLTATLVDEPVNGTLKLQTDGSFTYTPDADFNGIDVFTYQAGDGVYSSSVMAVTLTVTSVNDAPTVADHAYSVAEDGQLVVENALIAPDADVEGDDLTARLVTDAANGTLSLAANGSFRYAPDADFNGADGFTFRVSDGTDESREATVTLTVTAVNDAPVAESDAYEVLANTELSVTEAQGVLSNDSDEEGDSLRATVVTRPSNGTLTLNATGAFTYVPVEDFVGVDAFTYSSSDGTDDSSATTVTIDVQAPEETGCSTVPSSAFIGAPALLLGLLARRRRRED